MEKTGKYRDADKSLAGPGRKQATATEYFNFHIYCIQQEGDSFHQQIGIKFEEETNKVLHLEHCFVWC